MRTVFLIAVSTLCLTAASAAAPPQRVMSLNLCSDRMLFDFLAPARIVSVSWLASEGYGAELAAKAAQVGVNHGTAEEVLAQKPDLVVAGLYTAAGARSMLKRVGVPLLELPPAEDFATIRSNTRLLGRALGEDEKANALIARMDASLAELAATAPARRIRIAAWDGSGQVPGRGTLLNAILDAAGADNIAAQRGPGYARFDLEQLLAARPDLLAYGDFESTQPSLRTQNSHHPVLRRLYADRIFVYPQLAYICGLPETAEHAKVLRQTILRLLAGAKPQ